MLMMMIIIIKFKAIRRHLNSIPEKITAILGFEHILRRVLMQSTHKTLNMKGVRSDKNVGTEMFKNSRSQIRGTN